MDLTALYAPTKSTEFSGLATRGTGAGPNFARTMPKEHSSCNTVTLTLWSPAATCSGD